MVIWLPRIEIHPGLVQNGISPTHSRGGSTPAGNVRTGGEHSSIQAGSLWSGLLAPKAPE
jgi:hypothetical protein